MSTERGSSLVELLAAIALVGIVLVPLLELYPGTLESVQTAQSETHLSFAAQQKTEELFNLLRANINGPTSGTSTCTSVPNCWLVWTIATELSSATQGVGVLKTVSVVACQDRNANGACDSGEPQVRDDTKITSRP